MDNKKELNEFELEIVSGGGVANFGANRLRTPEAIRKLAKAAGVGTKDINNCLKTTMEVKISHNVCY